MTKRLKRAAGFTVIELLVVMSIMALLLGAVMAAKPKVGAIRVAAAARSVANGLRLARSAALTQAKETVFRVDLARSQFGVAGFMHDFPRGMSIEMTVAANERRGQNGDIRFYPDGQSSGGQIVLRLDGRSAKVAVNWLTGEPELNR